MSATELAAIAAKMRRNIDTLKRAAAEAEYFATKGRAAARTRPGGKPVARQDRRNEPLSEDAKKIMRGEFMRMTCRFKLTENSRRA